MHMYVYMCVYVCIHVHVIYACTYVSICIVICVCMHANRYIYVYVCIHTCIHTYILSYLLAFLLIYKLTCLLPACSHTYLHTCVCIYIYTYGPQRPQVAMGSEACTRAQSGFLCCVSVLHAELTRTRGSCSLAGDEGSNPKPHAEQNLETGSPPHSTQTPTCTVQCSSYLGTIDILAVQVVS